MSESDSHLRAKPIRVLQVLGQLAHGGLEVWLMNVLRSLDPGRVRFDFALHSLADSGFAPEARELGSGIFLLKPPRQAPLSYGRQLGRLLREQGPFDVVHSHLHLFSGVTLRVAARYGVPKRIAHSHTNDEILYTQGTWLRCGYRHLMRRMLYRYSTAGLACSSTAAAALYGPNWKQDSRWQVVPCGFDFSRFAALPSKHIVRQQLGIPPQRCVIGQVGRLSPEKNHQFSVRVLDVLVKRGIDAHLLLVGGGPLAAKIRAQLDELHLADRATLAGDQADVAPFVGAMDCKLMPSVFEGLGVVALEAQAAGVPVVASDCAPEEVIVVPGMVDRLPLERGPVEWADAVMRHVSQPPWSAIDTTKALAVSQYGIGRCLDRLYTIYQE